MKLESQVCSLELSKKLASLNVKQESAFVWINYGIIKDDWELQFDGNVAKAMGQEWYSAFTVAELGEMLWKAGAKNFIKAYGEVFNFKGTSFVGELGIMNLMRKTDMGAKILIYLLENKLITLN